MWNVLEQVSSSQERCSSQKYLDTITNGTLGAEWEDAGNIALQLVTQGITEKVSPWQQLKPGEAGEELGVTFTAQPRLGDGQGGQPSQLGQQGNTLNIAMHCEHIL